MVIRHYINEDYVRHGGYNEVGELNDVIILYPQVVPIPLNPYGCWDGYGYTGAMFGTSPHELIFFLNKFLYAFLNEGFSLCVHKILEGFLISATNKGFQEEGIRRMMRQVMGGWWWSRDEGHVVYLNFYNTLV